MMKANNVFVDNEKNDRDPLFFTKLHLPDSSRYKNSLCSLARPIFFPKSLLKYTIRRMEKYTITYIMSKLLYAYEIGGIYGHGEHLLI